MGEEGKRRKKKAIRDEGKVRKNKNKQMKEERKRKMKKTCK